MGAKKLRQPRGVSRCEKLDSTLTLDKYLVLATMRAARDVMGSST